LSEQSEKYDPAIRKELAEADWVEIIPRVLKYAAARAKKYHFLGDEVEPEELFHEAIARAYGIGKSGAYRNWNKAKYPKLENFLISVIKSMTSHEAEHAEKFVQEPLFHEDGEPKGFELSPDSKEMAKAFNPQSPENGILHSESFQSLLTELNSIEGEDEELGMVILCLMDGTSKPKDIADQTGYDVKKVYNILRRLRNRIKDFISA